MSRAAFFMTKVERLQILPNAAWTGRAWHTCTTELATTRKEALTVQDRRTSNTASKGGGATNNHTLKSLPYM